MPPWEQQELGHKTQPVRALTSNLPAAAPRWQAEDCGREGVDQFSIS